MLRYQIRVLVVSRCRRSGLQGDAATIGVIVAITTMCRSIRERLRRMPFGVKDSNAEACLGKCAECAPTRLLAQHQLSQLLLACSQFTAILRRCQ